MLLDSGKYLGMVSDFSEYYTVSWFLNNGSASEIYNLSMFGAKQLELFPELGERIVGFYLTPLVVPAFWPLVSVAKDFGYLVWVLLLILSVVSSVVLLSRFLKLDLRYSLMLFSFVSVAGPVYESLKLGQIGPFLLLAYVASVICLERKKDKMAGLLLAPFLAKPHLILPLMVFYAGARKYSFILSLFVLAFTLFLISLLVVGVDGWSQYFQLLRDNFMTKLHFTPTLRDQLRMLISNQSIPISIVCTLVQMVILAMLFVLGRKFKDRIDAIYVSMLLCLPCALLFSPYVQIYDWILFIPSLTIFFAKGYIDRIDKRLAYLIFALLFVLILPFSAFIHYYYVNKDGLFNPSFLVGLIYFVTALLSLKGSEKVDSN